MKNHQNSCAGRKQRLSTVLTNAKELFAIRKAKRLRALAIRKQTDDDSPEFIQGSSQSSNSLSESVGHIIWTGQVGDL
jgi:hypothetical protein